jgi:hypothetical protein
MNKPLAAVCAPSRQRQVEIHVDPRRRIESVEMKKPRGPAQAVLDEHATGTAPR